MPAHLIPLAPNSRCSARTAQNTQDERKPHGSNWVSRDGKEDLWDVNVGGHDGERQGGPESIIIKRDIFRTFEVGPRANERDGGELLMSFFQRSAK